MNLYIFRSRINDNDGNTTSKPPGDRAELKNKVSEVSLLQFYQRQKTFLRKT